MAPVRIESQPSGIVPPEVEAAEVTIDNPGRFKLTVDQHVALIASRLVRVPTDWSLYVGLTVDDVAVETQITSVLYDHLGASYQVIVSEFAGTDDDRYFYVLTAKEEPGDMMKFTWSAFQQRFLCPKGCHLELTPLGFTVVDI